LSTPDGVILGENPGIPTSVAAWQPVHLSFWVSALPDVICAADASVETEIDSAPDALQSAAIVMRAIVAPIEVTRIFIIHSFLV